MYIWKRAAGALKDQKSILVATFSRRTSYRNPDLEFAIIKATNHNESYVDYKNAQRVFAWIRTSPVSLKPLIRVLTARVEKTQDWVVALKSLMLLHGVFCCKTQAVLRIGRLPFDLSNFTDGHSKPSKLWGFNAFIRAYYAYLDQRSSLLYEQRRQMVAEDSNPMVQELLRLENWQSLLDMLLQIKPLANNMRESLILEAMDCVIIEIFDVYSRICNGVARVLIGIYSAGKFEATLALKVLQKAIIQGEDLASFFEFCREFGVFNAMEVPKVTKIPEEDLKDLERIINGVSERNDNDDDDNNHRNGDNKIVEIDKEIDEIDKLKTVITDKWEVFDEEMKFVNQGTIVALGKENPFEITHSSKYLPLIPVEEPVNYKQQEIPDFISFY
ncbi:putative clathrin assembly protein At1g25240 [Mercurialis annua]|uniref:putative clathrin assembly protein At1g25240 n=1 Tax=Mercurialis annua TaxID=3986 RepID=UPI00215E36B6|nr:putative clathrin assembly protein At1g25240 [Mercurialis annua]